MWSLTSIVIQGHFRNFFKGFLIFLTFFLVVTVVFFNWSSSFTSYALRLEPKTKDKYIFFFSTSLHTHHKKYYSILIQLISQLFLYCLYIKLNDTCINWSYIKILRFSKHFNMLNLLFFIDFFVIYIIVQKVKYKTSSYDTYQLSWKHYYENCISYYYHSYHPVDVFCSCSLDTSNMINNIYSN